MKPILITCGPSYEPIDRARRLTNFSTGRLGAVLTDSLADAGWPVWCLRGEGATHPAPAKAQRVLAFGTNDDLLQLLVRAAAESEFTAVLHAAALCDYRVARIEDSSGTALQSAKIPTRMGDLTLALAPATKVLPKLRTLFPNSRLVGWKYELEGGRDEALARARRQIAEARVDACVLNGDAYGPGFGFCASDGSLTACADPRELARLLNSWLLVFPSHLG